MPSSSSTVSTQTTQASSRLQSYPHTHACLSHQDSLQVLKKVLDTDAYDRKGAASVLDMVIETEHKRLKGVIENIDKIFPIQDPRLQHIVLYVMLCRASNEIIYVMLLDQFAEPVWDKNDKILKIRNDAVDHRKRMLSETAKLDIEYRLWHETFATYRRTAALFVKGVTIYFDEKYVQALSYILHAHRLSEELKRSRHKNAGLPDSRISAFFLRQTLLHINDTITQQFEDKSDVKTLIDSATMHVLPCLQTLVNNGSSDDIKAVEEIREKWCSFLGQEMESQKIELLQDFLSKLFDPPPELKIPDMPSLKVESYQSLHSNFQQVMKIAVESGYIERALETS